MQNLQEGGLFMRIKLTKQDITLTELWDKYITEKKLEGYSDDTIKGKEDHWKQLLKYLPDGLLASEMDYQYIEEFIADKKQTAKPVSINSYLRVYRAFFNWANAKGYTQPMHFTLLIEQERVNKTYSDSEIEAILEKPDIRTCSFPTYRDWVMINFFLATGCRRGTLAAIKVGDIDLDEGYIEINKTKTHKAQILPIPSSLKSILVEYMAIRGGKPSDVLFCNETGGAMEKHSITATIAKYNKRMGVHTTSVHSLRHTFSKTAIMKCNMNVARLQKQLGHSSLETTQQYVNLFDKDLLQNNEEYNPLNYYRHETKKEKIKMKR